METKVFSNYAFCKYVNLSAKQMFFKSDKVSPT